MQTLHVRQISSNLAKRKTRNAGISMDFWLRASWKFPYKLKTFPAEKTIVLKSVFIFKKSKKSSNKRWILQHRHHLLRASRTNQDSCAEDFGWHGSRGRTVGGTRGQGTWFRAFVCHFSAKKKDEAKNEIKPLIKWNSIEIEPFIEEPSRVSTDVQFSFHFNAAPIFLRRKTELSAFWLFERLLGA